MSEHHDLVGLDGGVAIIDLHVADGGHAFIGVVVIDLVRLHEHLLLPRSFAIDANLRLLVRRRTLREGEVLSCSRRRRKRKEAAADSEAEDATCEDIFKDTISDFSRKICWLTGSLALTAATLLLGVSGVGNAVSAVLRGTSNQLLTPDHLRGRVGAVNNAVHAKPSFEIHGSPTVSREPPSV